MSDDSSTKKIAFLHIPKTSGVSIVDAFIDWFGAERCAPFSRTISEETFVGKTFASGHVYLHDIISNAFIFTFLRDPVRQISSHLRWIDHYSHPEFEGEIRTFPESVRLGIQQIGKADFSDARSIDKYLQWLPRDSELRIANLQSEMLAFRRGQVENVSHKRLAALAIRNLNFLGFVGISEQFSADMNKLFRILGLGPDSPRLLHLNRSPSLREIDLALPSIRRVLIKYVEADLRLYDFVVTRRCDKEAPLLAERGLNLAGAVLVNFLGAIGARTKRTGPRSLR